MFELEVGIGIAVLVAVGAALFLLKKKKKEKKQAAANERTPAPQKVKTVSWGDAGFGDAISYKRWQQRNAFPKSHGQPTAAAIPYSDMRKAHELVMSTMTYIAQPGTSYENNPPYLRGDCEEFALMFRQRLMDLGYPVTCMRIAHGLVTGGGWHAFLCVWATSGLWTLDQRKSLPWPYAGGGYSQTGFEAGEHWGYFHQI